MKTTIIATLFAVLATTNAVAVNIDEDYSLADIKGSVQEDKAEEDFFADTVADCPAQVPVKQDWASYVNDNSHVIIGGVIVTTVAFTICFVVPRGERNCIAKNSDRIFKLLGIAPKVIEKIVEVEKKVIVEVEKEVLVYGGGGGGGVDYVEVPVVVQGPTQVIGVQSQKAWEAGMNMAAKYFGYKRTAFSADGTNHENWFKPEVWERMKELATGYLSNPDGGIGSLHNKGK